MPNILCLARVNEVALELSPLVSKYRTFWDPVPLTSQFISSLCVDYGGLYILVNTAAHQRKTLLDNAV